jgi:aminoglycoside phosphotransferase (APT) family kinase protein
MPQPREIQPRHAWLPALLPASARSFRVEDGELAETLDATGGDTADVEIASVGRLRGGATWTLVPVGPGSGIEGLHRAGEATVRLWHGGRVRAGAAAAARRLRRRGDEHVATWLWELGGEVRPAGSPAPRASARLSFGAVVRSGPETPTVLDEVLSAAARDGGEPFRPGAAQARHSGVLLVDGPQALLRVALGPARVLLDTEAAALERIHADGSSVLVSRVPATLARGREGLAWWSLEQRLAGGPSPLDPPPALVDDEVAFLAALHGLAGGDEPVQPSAAEDAQTLARAAGLPAGGALDAAAAWADGVLAGLPRGWSHGDFFPGNLLVTDDRLAGVVDWQSAAPGELPFLDLLQLVAHRWRWAHDASHAEAVLAGLVPWARRGGDAAAAAYADAIGVDASPELLEALVVAYWLRRAAFDARVYPSRVTPRWRRRHLDPVLAALGRDGRLAP